MRTLALIVALVCFLVVAAIGFGVLDNIEDVYGWLGTGLAIYVLSHLIPERF